MKPLDGILVVALEQAVAAPLCSSRLADAGARVIKIERPEGDFARGYDKTVYGESSYFVWINRGKESLALDLRKEKDHEQLMHWIAKADVFIQNLAPGATSRMGIGSDVLRQQFPRLITCDVSGYGESGPLHQLKAYDLLVQAESGLVAVSGASGPWGRIGVSICDITAGMNALIGIQQALLQRLRTGMGSAVKVSLFDSAADLMSVPYLQARYGGKSPERVGLKHPTIAPYGSFVCSDGRELVLSIQNEREWQQFCTSFMHQPDLPKDDRFSSNTARVQNRALVDDMIQAVFGRLPYSEAVDRLTEAQTAFGSINSVFDLIDHPQLRTKPMMVNGMTVQLPAAPYILDWDDQGFDGIPAVGEHGSERQKLRLKKAAAQLLANRLINEDHGCDLPAAIKPLTREHAYAIQKDWVKAMSDVVAGWKIAATSQAGQSHIGVSGPLAGPILSRRVHANGGTVQLQGNRMKVAECEVAFRLNKPLAPRPQAYSRQEVIDAIAAVLPIIEVPDSRFEQFETAGEAQLIADGACCRDVVLGAEVKADHRINELAKLPVKALRSDGEAFIGSGANVLGDPVEALVWLVHELNAQGITLESGPFITTGTCTTPIPVEPGVSIQADWGWIGTMKASFV